MRRPQDRVAAIEAVICREVGRGAAPLMAATAGNLLRAVESIAEVHAPRVGLITGFAVPTEQGPRPETDGPGGMAHMAAAFRAAGWPVRLATDALCAPACRVALAALPRAADVPVDLDDAATVARRWIDAGITHVISIERCGRARDGRPRNMRGEDVSAFTPALDDLFLAGKWRRIAIGDGGNEIGMGSLAPELIARTVPNGERIACATAADDLIVAGVSNWGGYGLVGALAAVMPALAPVLLESLDAEHDARLLERLVREGGTVDGVTRKAEATVDGMPPEVHAEVIAAIRAAAIG
ncbi:MAG: DUF4392 domain-containing protein [Alphaproteobacteria bacterium]|nr:DUF4392 domain-containing protein [Alphaproteobacteria bacterium]MCW5739811.1 DUF4392 domain-containing protein [Alphaproteobacteria bacterium]